MSIFHIFVLMMVKRFFPANAESYFQNRVFVLLILCIVYCFEGKAQTTSNDKEKISSLQFNLNYAGRFALIRSGFKGIYESSTSYPISNVGDVLNGSGINFGLQFIFPNGLGIKGGATFRYDHIYYTYPLLDSTQKFAQGINVQGLITDYHFSLLKTLGMAKKVKHRLELGYSVMNTGTSYPVSESIKIPSGWTTKVTYRDYRFGALHFHYAALIRNFNMGIGAYYGKTSAFEGLSSTYFIPEIRFGYNFKM